LGLRSIRLALRNVELFRTQLRAILRASVLGDVRLMFPLVSTLLELRQAKMVLSDAMEDLEEQGLPFNRDIQIGMMVEVPSAIMMLDRFVDEVDFFSIGTNDLIQYVLAVDRGNKDVANLYTAAEPAILHLIDRAIRIADEHGVPISMCGQMCGNPLYTMLLLGLGLRCLSLSPTAIPEIKQVCRNVAVAECQRVAAHTLTLDGARAVKSYLTEELKKVLPELPL
jgi:phosphotransferase system enzyme I (PtsI)